MNFILSCVVFLAIHLVYAATPGNSTLPSPCPCGYFDPMTKIVYTESFIVYFNETNVIDHTVFRILDYVHEKEKGWGILYRQGSDPANVNIGNVGSLPWQDDIDGNSSSLELWVDPPTDDHLVNGAQLRSARQDILFGTFRASLRSPQPWTGGSALTMSLMFNDSNSIELDMLNMNNATDAYVAQLVNGESPSYSLGTNYSILQKGSDTVVGLQPWDFIDVRFDWTNTSVDFWLGENRTRAVSKQDRTIPSVPQPLFLRHWSTGDVNFMDGPPLDRTVANVRFVRAFFNSSLMNEKGHDVFDRRCNISLACSIDDHTLRGSTSYTAAATIKWTQPVLDSHIRWVAGVVAGCFSTFGVLSLINASLRRTPWHKLKQLGVVSKFEKHPPIRKKSGATRASVSSQTRSMSVANVLKHALRNSIHSIRKSIAPTQLTADELAELEPVLESGEGGSEVREEKRRRSSSDSSGALGRASPPMGLSTAPSYRTLYENTHTGTGSSHKSITPLPSYQNFRRSYSTDDGDGLTTSLDATDRPTLYSRRATASDVPRSSMSMGESSEEKSSQKIFFPADVEKIFKKNKDAKTRLSRIESIAYDPFADGVAPEASLEQPSDSNDSESNDRVTPGDRKAAREDVARMEPPPEPTSVKEAMSTAFAPIPKIAPMTSPPPKRIDHLAGLVAVCCVGVTLRHFSLTFWPYVTIGYGNVRHFAADPVISYIAGPYVLSPFLIGPFFVTSCRFLVSRYLRAGKLSDIANKVLLRGARMLIPCFIFMLLEYFLLSLGLTGSLEYLPSISWSTWPSVTPQPNFGVFFNEMVQLAYLIPNQAPEVINHYCVGVLWTIPVQHFFSYVTLVGAVMVRDIKTPWKRFTFYGLAIVIGWYATSWSACHWAGLMLADMDITYDWIKRTQHRPWVFWPVLLVCVLVAGVTPLALLFNGEIFDWSFMSYENAIHPDPVTGRPLLDVANDISSLYPDYFDPSLAVLVYSVAIQIIVELSTTVQWVLGLKIFTVLHPHVMTIYLTHGFVFWSVGAYLVVTLSVIGLPYWAVLIITALICYTIIGLVAVIMSPLIEFTTQSAMKNMWRWATEEPVPHIPTTAPFSKDLIIGRGGDAETKPDA